VARAGEAQAKLNLLLEYRADYHERYQNALQKGMGGEWFRNYQTFLANLDQAITLQSDAVAALHREIAEAKKRVDSDQRRTESYQIIDDQRATDTLTRERRRQQRLQDEMATPTAQRLVENSNR